MKRALIEGRIGIKRNHGGPFGAVIVKDGKVIASDHNQVLRRHDPTCHGEIMAIRAASKKLKTHDLTGCEIYTTAEPCPMCLGAIMWANIEKIYYGCNVDDTEKIGFRDKKFYSLDDEAKAEMFSEVDRKDCLKLFKEYRALEKKKNY